MTNIGKFWDDIRTRHADAVARGEHDEMCEWRETGFYICNCRKRARLAAGKIDPPLLIYASPLCNGCGEEVDSDGDGWNCRHCHVTWNLDAYDMPGSWTDDNGPDKLLAEQAAAHDQAVAARNAAQA